MKNNLIVLFTISLLMSSCSKNNPPVDDNDNRSFIKANVDGNAYSATNVIISKDANSDSLLGFYSQTPDNLVIAIQLSTVSPGYAPGTYLFRAAGTAGVILVSLKGEYFNLAPQIKWVTDQESNLSYFGIERSDDGTIFTEIAKVSAVGNTTATHSYDFTDGGNLTYKKYYYRLKMVNPDGSYAYSQTLEMGTGYIAYYGEHSSKYKGFNGSVEITKNDHAAHTVSGNFFFDVKNTGGQIIQIRNGSFKVIY